jgi:hypothetical protein
MLAMSRLLALRPQSGREAEEDQNAGRLDQRKKNLPA